VNTREKIQLHESFWAGDFSNLLLIPPGRDMNETWQVQIYDTDNYEKRFYNPELMWENEIARAKQVLDWPTDGIPTIRPNLGVIFVPAIAGQPFEIRPGLMPWAKQTLTSEQIKAAADINIVDSELFKLAKQFINIHMQRGPCDIKLYHPDTQGIFDIAHLLYGENIFYDILDPSASQWVDELLDISMQLMTRTVDHLKKTMGEEQNRMFHGHGTEQGVFFPHCGIRISEDAPTMISPEMIDRFVIERIEKCGELFGGVFMHYCGKHDYFFEKLCSLGSVKAIDIGNPETYDTKWLFECCSRTNTVLYSRINALEDERWYQYIKRLAQLTKQTGARCILRPLAFPNEKHLCREMLDMWHELTK
jgi:hypothetical protein